MTNSDTIININVEEPDDNNVNHPEIQNVNILENENEINLMGNHRTHEQEPGTSGSGTENQSIAGTRQLNIAELLKRDSMLKSIEDLSRQLMKEQEQILKEYIKSQTVVAKHEMGVGSGQRALNFNVDSPEDSNYPPPPYSYNAVTTQQVYSQHETRLSEPAPSYYDTAFAFSSRRIRNKFVHKVYLILTTQLLITFGFVAVCTFVDPVKYFVLEKKSFFIVSSVSMVSLLLLLACFVSLRRIFPINFILLLLLTLCMSYTMGNIACLYSEKAVLYATASTATICAFITLIAWLNFFDITAWGFILFLAFLIVLLFGVISSIVYYAVGGSDVVSKIVALLIVLLVTVYLLYDTQKILGGGRVALSAEEYILGALTLYVDIMLIFNYLLLICIRR